MGALRDYFDRARRIPIEDELARRGIQVRGSKVERAGPCPVCGGNDRFSINVAKQVFNCRGCQCGGNGAIDLVMWLDGVPLMEAAEKLAKEPPPRTSANGHAESSWIYHDADGNQYLKVDRYEKPDGSKNYPQSHWDGARWVMGKPKGSKIPYRLPQLLGSTRAEPIYICEGEKCADAVAGLGLIATTASEGAGKWTPDLNEHFRDRIVYILPDNDPQGAKHAEQVARNLTGIASDVCIVNLPGMASKEDVFDWIARGGTREQLDQLGYAAPRWQDKGEDNGIGQDATGTMRESPATPLAFDPKPYQFPDPATIPPRQWLYGRHYLRGVVSGTIGAPGRLKSTTLLTEMVGMSAGRDLIGGKLLESGPLRAAYLNGEETQDELDRRVAAIMLRYGIKPEDCAGRLWVVSTRDAPIRFAVMGPKNNAVIAHDVVDAVIAWCEAQSIDVFGVDPLVSFHQVRENDPGDMDMLYKEGFGRIAGKERRAVDLAIHPRKPAQGEINTSISDLRGTGAQEAALRIARVFNFMTTTEASQLGIEEDDRRLYVRIDGGKGGPGPIAKANWIKIAVEPLPNGDDIAVAVAWIPENPFTRVAQGDLQVVQRVAQSGAFRAESRSPDWLGWWMAENLPHLNIKTRYNDRPRSKASKGEIAKLTQILATWTKNNGLNIVEREDEHRKPRKFFDAELPTTKPIINLAEDECATAIN